MTTFYSVHVQDFEGPLDLLLHLIETQKMAIADIQIASITDQYMAYLRDSLSQQMDVASDFIVMAATLIAIKARSLLPKPISPAQADEFLENGDPELLLKERLLEYRAFKAFSAFLKQKEAARQQLASRLPMPLEPFRDKPVAANYLADLTPAKLARIYMNIMNRLLKDPDLEVYRDRESIPVRMARIERQLRNGPMAFTDLVEMATRRECVTVLLAILELIQLRKVVFRQERVFGDIWIERI